MKGKNRHQTPSKAAQFLLARFNEAASLAVARGELLGIKPVGITDDPPAPKTKRTVEFAATKKIVFRPKIARTKLGTHRLKEKVG